MMINNPDNYMNAMVDNYIDSMPDDYIDNKVQEICRNIWKEGPQGTAHYDVFMFIYEHVKDNIYKYLPENPWDYGY